jgi:hypothetical protein
LYDKFKIEIIDNKKYQAQLEINHLIITEIEYNDKKKKICFLINEGKIVQGHKVNCNRINPANPDIRTDIVTGLKKLSEIPTNISIATILYDSDL